MVEYSTGNRADHWCSKGHILLCIEGELYTELSDGRKFTLTPGISYQVGDNAEPHRSYPDTGAKPFIVDWQVFHGAFMSYDLAVFHPVGAPAGQLFDRSYLQLVWSHLFIIESTARHKN